MKLILLKSKRIIIVTCIVPFLVSACKKNNTPVSSQDALPTSFYDSVFGCTFYPGVPARFSPYPTVNIPAGTSYLWDFGDSTTSTEEFPTHSYAIGGSYNVTLSFNGSTVKAINQPVYVTPVTGSHYTLQMGGTREWVGTIGGAGLAGSDLDTMLMVQVVDSGIVTFQYDGAPMYLSYIDTLTDKYIEYHSCPGGGILTYYYLNDSMAYSLSILNSAFGHPRYISIHTK